MELSKAVDFAAMQLGLDVQKDFKDRLSYLSRRELENYAIEGVNDFILKSRLEKKTETKTVQDGFKVFLPSVNRVIKIDLIKGDSFPYKGRIVTRDTQQLDLLFGEGWTDEDADWNRFNSDIIPEMIKTEEVDTIDGYSFIGVAVYTGKYDADNSGFEVQLHSPAFHWVGLDVGNLLSDIEIKVTYIPSKTIDDFNRISLPDRAIFAIRDFICKKAVLKLGTQQSFIASINFNNQYLEIVNEFAYEKFASVDVLNEIKTIGVQNGQ